MEVTCFICDAPAAACGHNPPAPRGTGVQIMKETIMAKKDLVAEPWSEPMVFHDAGMTPISEYEGNDAPPADTVGVIDEPAPSAVPPRAVVLTAEQQRDVLDAAATAAADAATASTSAKKAK